MAGDAERTRRQDVGGVQLPPVAPAVGCYAGAVRAGGLLFVAGHGPVISGRAEVHGKVGAELSTEEGRSAARLATLSLLATASRESGGLENLKRPVRVLVFVNCTPEFHEQPRVADGASELLFEIFGAHHARSAIGVTALPFGIPVEVEAVFEMRETPDVAA